ncbi:MAG: GyrI-like domain-containing protein [Chloroflexota bacterium]
MSLDMKKTHKTLYAPSAKAVSVVDVPPLNYLMIDGAGNPNTAPRYTEAVVALYKMAYGIRAISKADGEVFTVMPLEGLWTLDGEHDPNVLLTDADKDKFVWTLMIVQPEHVTAEMVDASRENVAARKDAPALLGEVRFETYHEGESVQQLHLGPYTSEGPTIAGLHDHIEANGWSLGKPHHEIYLNDPRKVAPEKIKTVIRQPFDRQ